jgi:hypothetical protein
MGQVSSIPGVQQYNLEGCAQAAVAEHYSDT